jgi:hypothetical protein
MRVGLTQNLDDLPDFPTVVVFRQRVPPYASDSNQESYASLH